MVERDKLQSKDNNLAQNDVNACFVDDGLQSNKLVQVKNETALLFSHSIDRHVGWLHLRHVSCVCNKLCLASIIKSKELIYSLHTPPKLLSITSSSKCAKVDFLFKMKKNESKIELAKLYKRSYLR